MLRAPAKGIDYLLIEPLWKRPKRLALVALATAECAQIVGVLLVFALMVGPAAASQRLTTNVLSGVALSAALALAEAWAGLSLAFYTDWPTSFWICTLSALIYFVSGWPWSRPSCAPSMPS